MSRTEAQTRLRGFIGRIERLEEERVALVADIGEVYGEAGGEGFDTKVMRRLVSRRKKDRADLEEEDSLLATYERAMTEGEKDEEPDPLA